jgi:hypothetical protein
MPQWNAKAAQTSGIQDAQQIQAEIQHEQKEIVDNYQSLNSVNPMAAPNGVTLASGLSGSPNLAALQNLMNQPQMKKYVRLVTSPEFARDLGGLIEHPMRMQLVYWEAAWLFAIILLRAWQNSKSKHWLRKVWIYLWTLGVFWIGSLVVVPRLVLGEAYSRFFSDCARILGYSIHF